LAIFVHLLAFEVLIYVIALWTHDQFERPLEIEAPENVAQAETNKYAVLIRRLSLFFIQANRKA
jgi:hypothetical protein